jgi:hypothetical protein
MREHLLDKQQNAPGVAIRELRGAATEAQVGVELVGRDRGGGTPSAAAYLTNAIHMSP